MTFHLSCFHEVLTSVTHGPRIFQTFHSICCAVNSLIVRFQLLLLLFFFFFFHILSILSTRVSLFIVQMTEMLNYLLYRYLDTIKRLVSNISLSTNCFLWFFVQFNRQCDSFAFKERARTFSKMGFDVNVESMV